MNYGGTHSKDKIDTANLAGAVAPNNVQYERMNVNPEYPNLNEINQQTNLQPRPNINEINQQTNFQPRPNYENCTHHIPSVEREVIFVEERPVYFGYDDPYPVTSKTVAWLILFINIFLPGVGTLIIGCLDGVNSCYFILSGIFQILTAWLIIGWIMAIWTSVILMMKAQ